MYIHENFCYPSVCSYIREVAKWCCLARGSLWSLFPKPSPFCLYFAWVPILVGEIWKDQSHDLDCPNILPLHSQIEGTLILTQGHSQTSRQICLLFHSSLGISMSSSQQAFLWGQYCDCGESLCVGSCLTLQSQKLLWDAFCSDRNCPRGWNPITIRQWLESGRMQTESWANIFKQFERKTECYGSA